jgi:hypothetical protein
MVESALEEWNLNELDFLFIENVGNLVCPSSSRFGRGPSPGSDVSHRRRRQTAKISDDQDGSCRRGRIQLGSGLPQYSGCPAGHAGVESLGKDGSRDERLPRRPSRTRSGSRCDGGLSTQAPAINFSTRTLVSRRDLLNGAANCRPIVVKTAV